LPACCAGPELAGHDPRQMLQDAVTERTLTGATNTTNFLHPRITDGDTRRFDPIGERWADWAPHTGDANDSRSTLRVIVRPMLGRSEGSGPSSSRSITSRSIGTR